MRKKGSQNLLSMLVLMATIGTPAAFYYAYHNTNSLLEGAKIAAIYLLLVAFSGLVADLWNVFKQTVVSIAAKRLRRYLKDNPLQAKKEYLDYLIALYRYLDTRSLIDSDNRKFLDLQGVFVPLQLRGLGQRERFYTDDHVWKLLSPDERGQGARIVILGRPGSGKTTLLRFLTLRLAEGKDAGREIPRKFPVLLSYRDCAESIVKDPGIGIVDLFVDYYEKQGMKLPPTVLNRPLQKGGCVVLLDGLDEVAKPEIREKVVEWTERQMAHYSRSHFVVSSRPHGYEKNRLLGASVYLIEDFDDKQIEEFVDNWYLEYHRRRSEPGDQTIRFRAQIGASKLYKRILENPHLHRLALNPMLLTMIAIVFSAKENLPGRRVELYKEMIEVILSQRSTHSVGLEDPLSMLQKEKILRLLAYYMMQSKATTINKAVLLNAIEEPLASESTRITKEEFLRLVVEEYTLLMEIAPDTYGFTHHSFQEYLSSVYVIDERKLEDLVEKVGRDDQEWWEELIRLFCAQTNATPIMAKCLEFEPIPIPVLTLAKNILAEALQMDPAIRARIEDVLKKLAENPDQKLRDLSARAAMSTRLRFMKQFHEGEYIDESVISNREYKLFVDEMQDKELYVFPDHWCGPAFPKGTELDPLIGARPSDVLEFCEWVTNFDVEPTKYRIPTIVEAQQFRLKENGRYYVMAHGEIVVHGDDQSADAMHPEERQSIIVDTGKAIDFLERDITEIHSLSKAVERKGQPIPTTTELLARTERPYYHGGGQLKSKASDGMTGRFYSEGLDDILGNRRLLEDYEVYADLLHLEFLPLIQVLEHDFFEDHDHRIVHVQRWMQDSLSHSRLPFDIGKNCLDLIAFIDRPEIRNLLDAHSKQVRGSIIMGLEYMHTRRWITACHGVLNNPEKLFAFLRWYNRVCLLDILAVIAGNNDLNSLRNTRESIFLAAKQLLIDFVVFETRILAGNVLLDGIRLVREQIRND